MPRFGQLFTQNEVIRVDEAHRIIATLAATLMLAKLLEWQFPREEGTRSQIPRTLISMIQQYSSEECALVRFTPLEYESDEHDEHGEDKHRCREYSCGVHTVRQRHCLDSFAPCRQEDYLKSHWSSVSVVVGSVRRRRMTVTRSG